MASKMTTFILQRFHYFRDKHKSNSFLKAIISSLKEVLTWCISKIILTRINNKGILISMAYIPRIKNRGFISLGNRVCISSAINRVNIVVNKGATLDIGDNSRINGARIFVASMVKIGNNVDVSPYVLIMDSDFSEQPIVSPIVIEDNVTIARRATILPGVTIGRGSVIAAGTIVADDVPPYSLVAGVPARIVRRLRPSSPTIVS
jgi:acetyltransferase-like isoleucine patch superfamily enzyme